MTHTDRFIPKAHLSLLAFVFVGAGCFEVPPLPDTVPDCVGSNACSDDEVCSADGRCVPVNADTVFIEVTCMGVEQSVVGVLCGGEPQGLRCTGDGATDLFECPVGAPIDVCCGESDDVCLGRSVDLRPLVYADHIEATPDDGWDCDEGPHETDLICSHDGFAPSADIVASIFCDVQRDAILGK